MKLCRLGKKVTMAGIAAVITAVAMYCVVCGSIQRWIIHQGVRMLSDRLETVVSLDSVDVSIAQRQLSLYGLTIEDRQQNNMLKVDTMTMKVALVPLFHSRLDITRAQMHGVSAMLYKERRDTAANYQFVIDAFKKPKTSDVGASDGRKHKPFSVVLHSLSLSRLTMRWDVHSEPVKKHGRFDPNHIYIVNTSLAEGSIEKSGEQIILALRRLHCEEQHSGMTLRIANADYHKWRKDSTMVELWHGDCAWRDMKVRFRSINARQSGGAITMRKPLALHIDSLAYHRNNGRPHKRTGRPHRGYFDAGHVNALLNADAVLRYATPDSTLLDISSMAVCDKASGIDIRSFTTSVTIQRDTITLYNMRMRLPQSRLEAKEICGTLIRDVKGKAHDVQIRPFLLSARMTLRDIARPFAPVLSDFTTPLDVSVTTDGTLERMRFSHITVKNRDNRLLLTARGDMRDVTKRYDLRLHFNDIRLRADRGVKETIVGHFSKKVRMKMIRQMQKIGDIRYRGNVTVAFRREDIDGTLYTKYGNADFAFTIDGKSKLMTGVISTDSLALGSIMNVKGLGSMKAKAYYGFNVASKSKRKVKSNGRLPIGWMNATVEHASFKRIQFRDVSAVMHSDGSTAVGEIVLPKKLFDISLTFWYTQTDSVQNLKFKPKLSRHKQKEPLVRNMKKWRDYIDEARKRATEKREGKNKGIIYTNQN